MFDERTALKMRLEQMRDAEERLLNELQKERAFIFNRLRELDEKVHRSSDLSPTVKYLETANSFIEGPADTSYEQHARGRKGRPSRRSKTTKMRDTAIDILKEQAAPMRGTDLQKLIETRTGFRIANMTTFMKTIEKADENIKKIGRGLYFYKMNEDTHTNEPILLGSDELNIENR